MDVAELIHSMAVKARAAAGEMRKLSTAQKNALLLAIADRLEADKAVIVAANAEDVAAAKANGLSPAMVDRLTLTDARFKSMVDGVRYVAELPDPVGEAIWTRERPSGITINKVRVPLGVIAVVFESRPNVFVDTAALCLKTGNAVILRGGKEAIETNRALAKAVSGVFFSRDRNVASPLAFAHQFNTYGPTRAATEVVAFSDGRKYIKFTAAYPRPVTLKLAGG